MLYFRQPAGSLPGNMPFLKNVLMVGKKRRAVKRAAVLWFLALIDNVSHLPFDSATHRVRRKLQSNLDLAHSLGNISDMAETVENVALEAA